MPLNVGDRLGPYEITGELGAGGMGIVLRARDTKVDRDVALKVLPEAFTQDPDRLARFEREAKVLASLNHPNIGSIYVLEEAEGGKFRALVLELVEGPTLADRIKRGPIPLDEALPIAKQIAEALEAAHEQGVIHRGLKPANIKVREDGTVKVLDFGLAKAFQPDASDPNMSQSPTISLTAAATQRGMVLGTAAYMAPEQAKGKPIDKRADIWAFGAVLFEMLTGQKPFVGDDVSKTLARVIDREPDWSALPKNVPPVLGTFLRGCLEKNPKQRVHDVADVRLAMEGAFEPAVTAVSEPTASLTLRVWQRPSGIAATALMTLALGALAVWGLRVPDVPSVTRFTVQLPSALVPGPGPPLALSRDGGRLVYAIGSGQLYSRSLDQLEATAIPGTDGARVPFFSPDGQWVGFADNQALEKVSLAGGPPFTLCPVPAVPGGATWGQDETIVFTDQSRSGLMVVSAAGGEPTPLTTVNSENGEMDHLWPDMTPDGRAVLFTVWSGSVETAQIAVVSLATGEQTTLTVEG